MTGDMTEMEALNVFSKFTNVFFTQMSLEPKDMDMTNYGNSDVDDLNQSTRQWLWQSCTEFGYWQM